MEALPFDVVSKTEAEVRVLSRAALQSLPKAVREALLFAPARVGFVANVARAGMMRRIAAKWRPKRNTGAADAGGAGGPGRPEVLLSRPSFMMGGMPGTDEPVAGEKGGARGGEDPRIGQAKALFDEGRRLSSEAAQMYRDMQEERDLGTHEEGGSGDAAVREVYMKAAEKYRDGIALCEDCNDNKQRAQGWYGLGVVQRKSGNAPEEFETALKSLMVAASYDPYEFHAGQSDKCAALRYNKGIVYFQLCRFDEAVSELTAAVTLQPTEEKLHRALEAAKLEVEYEKELKLAKATEALSNRF